MDPKGRETEAIESRLPLNMMDFLVLAVLSDGECHGYGIVKSIEARTEGKVRVRPGNLYRVVDRLMEQGLVEARGRSDVDGSAGNRRHYGITALGRKVVASHVELFTGFVAASSTLKSKSRLAHT